MKPGCPPKCGISTAEHVLPRAFKTESVLIVYGVALSVINRLVDHYNFVQEEAADHNNVTATRSDQQQWTMMIDDNKMYFFITEKKNNDNTMYTLY